MCVKWLWVVVYINKNVGTRKLPGKDGNIYLFIYSTSKRTNSEVENVYSKWCSLRSTIVGPHRYPLAALSGTSYTNRKIAETNDVKLYCSADAHTKILTREWTHIQYLTMFALIATSPSINIRSQHCKVSMKSTTCQRRCTWPTVWPSIMILYIIYICVWHSLYHLQTAFPAYPFLPLPNVHSHATSSSPLPFPWFPTLHPLYSLPKSSLYTPFPYNWYPTPSLLSPLPPAP